MNIKKIVTITAAALFLTGCCVPCFCQKKPVNELKILTIGNSFAWSVFSDLKQIASAQGSKLTLEAANIGGCTFERHWKNYEKSMKDPAFKPYGKKYNLKEKLLQEKWDIVTIQQASASSWKPETYHPYADNIIKLVRQYAPQAEIVIQQTWSYNNGSQFLIPNNKKYWGFDQNGMYKRLDKNYTALAKQYKFRMIPSGYAIQIYRKSLNGKLDKIDPVKFSEFKHPVLPANNDLVGNFGWKKNNKNNQYKLSFDASHLNKRGQYLQACVWYGYLFGKDPTTIKYIPKKMQKQDALNLQKIAKQAIAGYPQTKN